eukprot:SAG31_NODE_5520_length_2482_cov_1.771297_1_plen_133_part_00
MKTKKSSSCIIYSITDDNKSVECIEKLPPSGDCKADWEVFRGKLNGDYASKPVYAAFDFSWEAEDGHTASKLLFVTWVPEGASIKKKMLTTSTKDAVKRALIGVGQDFQCTDSSENTYEEALDKCKSSTTVG